MRKSLFAFGLVGLAGSAIIAACGHQSIAASGDAVRAWIGGPVASVARMGTATLVVRPSLNASGRHVQANIVPFFRADVHHLVVELWRTSGEAALQASVQLTSAQLDSPITFEGLSAETTYAVKCFAYAVDADNPGAYVKISADGPSSTTVTVTNNETVAISVYVKLLDSDFTGSGTSTITIEDGTYSVPASPAITVATPTPAPDPTSAPTLSATYISGGTLATVANLVAIAGAQVGSDYLLSLDRRPGSDFMDHYYLRWGTSASGALSDFQSGSELDLGSSWPPAQTIVSGPSGAGMLTVQFQGAVPTGGFPFIGTVAVM